MAYQLAGISGTGTHISNTLMAIYLATGQDPACIAENAVGFLDMEINDDDLHFSLMLPSITVGTVGGATRLQQQSHHLEMLGCKGEHSSRRLAEIICAAALGLEISLIGAILSNEFSSAHKKYGR